MNKSLLTIAGFMMVLALVAAAPGTARAVPFATVLTLDGPSVSQGSYTSGNAWVIKEGPDSPVPIPGIGAIPIPAWVITAWNSLTPIITDPVSGGIITISGSTIEITGRIIGLSFPSGKSFDITGILVNPASGSNSYGSYYSWLVTFANVANPINGLGNGDFSVAGTYGGGIALTATGGLDLFTLSSTISTTVPAPSALLLFAPGLLGLIGMRKRFKG